MRSAPVDLPLARLGEELADGWQLGVASMDFVPEGGGSHHWRVVDQNRRAHFVTVDDLGDKDWLGDTPETVFPGLRRALSTARRLRDDAGLEYVVAPIAARDGEPLRRLDGRYTVSVFPFLVGRSHPFGAYTDLRLRDRAVDMVASLHRATDVIRDGAPGHAPRYARQRLLHDFLTDPGRPWPPGPFAEPARALLVDHVADLAELATGFDHLVDATESIRADTVITHGEPHPGNLMSVDGRVVLIDWDTTALAPPERDLSTIAPLTGECIERYESTTGREIHVDVMTLYRLRWYLDDVGSAVRMFSVPHSDNADTRGWWQALPEQLEQLPQWLGRLSRVGE